MASGDTTGTVQCPACKEPITFPVHARHLTKTKVAVSVDLTPVREHTASHEARLVTELPGSQTATVHLDNSDATYTPSQPPTPLYPDELPDRCCGCVGSQCCNCGDAPCSMS